MNTLKISKRIPGLNLDKDQALIQLLEQNYFDYIDIDEINSKYELMHNKIKNEVEA